MATSKNKKNGTGWLAWIWILVIVGGLLSSVSERVDFRRLYLRFQVWLYRNTGLRVNTLLPIVVIVIALLVIYYVARAAKARREQGAESGAVRRPDPRAKSFTKPEAYCAVHDHSGEDHLAHDKSQRIAQLDEWLKIGLIDKAEYRVLKDRYQRDL